MGPRNRRTAGNIAEIFLNNSPRLYRIEIAGDCEACVAWRVVGAEKGGDVLSRCCSQIIKRTNREPVVGMIRRVESFVNLRPNQAIRDVIVVLTFLILYYIALVSELRFVEHVKQTAHAIGFHEKRQLEKV